MGGEEGGDSSPGSRQQTEPIAESLSHRNFSPPEIFVLFPFFLFWQFQIFSTFSLGKPLTQCAENDHLAVPSLLFVNFFFSSATLVGF